MMSSIVRSLLGARSPETSGETFNVYFDWDATPQFDRGTMYTLAPHCRSSASETEDLRLTGALGGAMIHAVRAGNPRRAWGASRAVPAGGRGRIRGIPSTRRANTPLIVLIVYGGLRCAE